MAKLMKRLLAPATALILSSAPAAAQIEGASLPSSMSAYGQSLQLASCAQRETLWLEPYAVSLYLPQQRTAKDYILDPQTPKIVRLDVTYEGSVPDDIPAGWQERLRQELSGEIYNAIQRIYSGLTTGDTVVFAYAPGQGTTVTVNGKQVKATGDNGLIAAMLSVWLGEDPVSQNMKRLLLQSGC